MPVRLVAVTLALLILAGCESIKGVAATYAPPGSLAESPADAAPASLFPGDQLILSDQQIQRIFDTPIAAPPNAKIAVVRHGSWPAWYWSEEFARLDQQSLDGLMSKLKAVPGVRTVQVVPEMLVPRQMDVPHLRETAARVQADLLLIYRPTSHSYQKSRLFKRDRTRAYCTVEAALLDTRSGVITYTARATENYAADEAKGDVGFEETVARAEQEAIGRAMAHVGEEVAAFLRTPPPTTQVSRGISAVTPPAR